MGYDIPECRLTLSSPYKLKLQSGPEESGARR